MSTTALTDSARERLCCEAIHQYIFDNVYNEPVSEYRVNILPMLLKQQSVVGSVNLFGANMTLPTDDEPYYIWLMSASDFNIGLLLPENTWVDTATIANEYRTLLHMYGPKGYMFHKGSVYLKYNTSRSIVHIAAKKNMVRKCIDVGTELNRCYLTVYYDSDTQNPVTALSLHIASAREANNYQRQIDDFWGTVEKACQLQVYKNGVEVTDIDNTPTFEVGDYIDLINDKNIAFAFDIDLVNTSENPTFYSEYDKAYKQLLHIPKSLNPDNKILTHNTCDFWVRQGLADSTHGLYLHRIAKKRSITQVTHNDMAVQLFVLDAYRDYLQTQEIKLHCAVRIHEKDNYLIRDASFIDLLYCDKHSDDDIIKILSGKGPENIPWWKAENLEKSKYVEMMFDTPDSIDISHMKDYVDALGYYQVINLLCRRVNDVILTDGYTGTLTYRLPIIYTGMDVIPVVYLNDRAIRREYITYINNGNGTVSVTVDSSIYTKPGDRMTVIFYITGNNNIYHVDLTVSNLTTTVPYTSVSVYQKITLPVADALQGVGAKYREVWKKLEPGTTTYLAQVDESSNTTAVTINYELAGNEFLICNNYCSYVQSIDLAKYTDDGRTIAVPATATFDGTIDPCPILNFSNLSLYLNGVYLVRDIDYTVNTVTDSDGNVAMKELVIQTMDHFNPEGKDILDIVYNVAEIEDNSCGFVVDDILKDQTPVNLYFPNISMTHVDGKIARDVDYRGVYIALPEDPDRPQGQIFEIQTSIPQLVKDFVDRYATNQDLERMKIMNEYFYDLNPINKDVLVLEGKHRIYSTFINNLLYDIVHGDLIIIDDPDDNRFKDQIKQYLPMRDKDLCYLGLDQRFVDYYPQYVNYEVDPDTKRLLDRIIQTYMPENQDPTMEVIYELS